MSVLLLRRAIASSYVDPVLFRYRPGDAGYTHSRGSTATYYDANGVIQTAAINALRDGHYIGGLRHVLLEEQRTNLALRSIEYDNATWSKDQTTVSANATTGPDGASTADKIAETATTAEHDLLQLISGTSVVFSQHVKAAERSRMALMVTGGTNPNMIFNLSTQTAEGKLSDVGAAATAYGLVTLGSGWYRPWIYNPASSTRSDTYLLAAGSARSYAGTLGSGMYFGGAQLEVGTFPTSYIPTTAGSVTREADSMTLPSVDKSGTLFYRYYDLATAAYVDVAAAYTAGTTITPPVNRAYTNIAVVRGSKTAAECASILRLS